MTAQLALLRDFKRHLEASGLKRRTVVQYMAIARRFLRHVNGQRLDRLSEETVRSFFTPYSKGSRSTIAPAVIAFLRFAAARLPVPMTERGSEMAPVAPKTRKELALRERWSLEKLTEEKNKADDLIAKLARKVIDHYLYFQGRIKGEPENLDDICRFTDECRELIQSNLPLFMEISAGGRNVHSAIDERVQK